MAALAVSGLFFAQPSARADNVLVPIYQKGCDGGDAALCQSLGVIYNEGRDVPVDKAKAAALFAEACNGGADVACRYAADLYAKGDGVAKDGAKAAALYQRGCDLHDKDSCARLAQDAPPVAGAPTANATAAATTRVASAAPTGARMRYKAQNQCEGGSDNASCVSCEFHDCRIGEASGVLATGSATVRMAGVATVKITTSPSNYLSVITHFEPSVYKPVYGTFPQGPGDKPMVCSVDISDAGDLVSPQDARAYIETYHEPADFGREIDLKLFQMGPYEGVEKIFVDDKTRVFRLVWHVLYKTVEITKYCAYAAKPGFSEPHYTGIAISIDVPERQPPPHP